MYVPNQLTYVLKLEKCELNTTQSQYLYDKFNNKQLHKFFKSCKAGADRESWKLPW